MTTKEQLEQQKFNELAAGMDEVNMKMAEEIHKSAPYCHMRKMSLAMSDSVDEYYTQWWECSVCGHTKDYP